MNLPIPSFTVPGIVSESRDLKSKSGNIWAYAVRLVAMGGTFELQTVDEQLARSVSVGQMVTATGRFENFNNAWKFVVTKFDRGQGANTPPALPTTGKS